VSELAATAGTLLALAGVIAVSFFGMATFVLGRRLQNALPYLVSVASGALLGTAFAHLLPEAIQETGSGLRLSGLLTVGFLGSFALERILLFLFRTREPFGGALPCLVPEYGHPGYEHQHVPRRMLVPNIVLGGAVHSFIDGLAIATAFSVTREAGVATTIAVVLHEVPHHIADVGVLIYGGLDRTRAVLLNLLATSACAAGGGLVLLIGLHATCLTATLLPLTAANFLYIATAILLPELQKEQDGWRSVKQIACLFAGVALMFGLSALARD
jgi:zinc and cadmium transporter